jgi:hypothetical protein
VATLSTEHSKSTRRSLRDGSRRPYGGGCFVYLVQILSTCAVTRAPSRGSSSETSRFTVHLRLTQWYGFAGFIRRTVSRGFARIHWTFFRWDATLTSTVEPL